MTTVRIGVISDTHGARERALDAVKRMGPVEMLLHAGDHYVDAEFLAGRLPFPVYGVRGNCDLTGPAEQIVDAGGIRFLVIHGHQYSVKRNLDGLIYRAMEVEAQVVIFGHTHHPEEEWADGILLFNPGSISRPRGFAAVSTFGTITVEDGQPKPYLHNLD